MFQKVTIKVLSLATFVIWASTLPINVNAAERCTMYVDWMERPSYQYATRSGNPADFDIAYVKALAHEM